MLGVRGFFRCFLHDPGCVPPNAISVVPEGWTGNAADVPLRTALPTTRTTTFALPGVTTFGNSGKAVRTTPPLRQAIEVFGSPKVDVSIAASGGWSRLVAVLTASTPKGGEILVSAGGVPTKPGARKVTIRLIDQATYIPKGSRLQLTLASSSTAQSPGNLLYLDLPMRATARARVGTAVVTLPGLRNPVTR
jgi:predicted acyl esterase